jgi:hypothetical protein
MKEWISKIRTAATLCFLSLSLVGAIGNYRRHRTHEEHSQTCQCFSGCQQCVVTAVRGN